MNGAKTKTAPKRGGKKKSSGKKSPAFRPGLSGLPLFIWKEGGEWCIRVHGVKTSHRTKRAAVAALKKAAKSERIRSLVVSAALARVGAS